MKYSLCDGWEFTSQWSEEFLAGCGKAQAVRLPHTCKELPLHCIDPVDYQMLCGYRRTLDIPPELADKRLFLQLDGAAHIATVYVNGAEAATHRCGYTAFRVELTGLVKTGGNLLAVKLDTSENPAIPPSASWWTISLTAGCTGRRGWTCGRAAISRTFLSPPPT